MEFKDNLLKGCGGKNTRKVAVLEVRKLVFQRKKRKLIEIINLE